MLERDDARDQYETADQLVLLANRPGMPDLQFFSSPEALDAYEVAIETALSKAYAEFDHILQTPSENISFANIVERSALVGETLNILFGIINHFKKAGIQTKHAQKIVERFTPKIVEFGNTIGLSSTYYRLLCAIRDSDEELTEAQQRSLELRIRAAEHHGVHLPEEQKNHLKQINKTIAVRSEEYDKNIVESTKHFTWQCDEQTELLGDMPEQDRAMAKAEMEETGITGLLFTLQYPSYIAIQKYCTDRDIRKRFYDAYQEIGATLDYDNRPLILEILRLRQESATILGYKTWADYILAHRRMANHPEQVLQTVNLFAHANRKKGAEDLQELKECSGLEDFSYWDFYFYERKLIGEKYNIDENELRQYFPLKQTIQGMFGLAERLYGVTFQAVNVPTYHEDVHTYAVEHNGQIIAYFLLDLFNRPDKEPGACCEYIGERMQLSDGTKRIPVIVNISNFGKGSASTPPLLTHEDVVTMFHEFGHGLHVMLSEQPYDNINAFSSEWDFVELPSQFHENFCWERESLDTFAQHFSTGQPIPEKMLQRMDEKRKALSGIRGLRQNQFAYLDMSLYTNPPPKTPEDLDATCLRMAQEHCIIPYPPNYKMHPHFPHLFSAGYDAGYYSYLWANILQADAFERFKEEGILNPALGDIFRCEILAPGALRSGSDLFRAFRGRDPIPDALMRKEGLAEE